MCCDKENGSDKNGVALRWPNTEIDFNDKNFLNIMRRKHQCSKFYRATNKDCVAKELKDEISSDTRIVSVDRRSVR